MKLDNFAVINKDIKRLEISKAGYEDIDRLQRMIKEETVTHRQFEN